MTDNQEFDEIAQDFQLWLDDVQSETETNMELYYGQNEDCATDIL